MNTLKEYILEARKYFTLDEHERHALADFVGIICGNIGEDSERNKYSDLYDSLTQKEKDQLSSCHDFLEDDVTYKTVNRNNLKDDIELLKKVLDWAFEHDLLDNQWDLQDAYDKILVNI